MLLAIAYLFVLIIIAYFYVKTHPMKDERAQSVPIILPNDVNFNERRHRH
uniref:Uncharacterized protein n=1 Tax=Wuchereria bancrofti TaxID=6293 RepID=A0AAF5RWD3_WUCBA